MLEQKSPASRINPSGSRADRVAESISSRARIQDCLFLTLIVLLSLILYIRGLGFYSDDWHFLGLLSTSGDQSLLGLIETVFPSTRLRPLQTLYVAGLYWLFGVEPLGYHIVNAAVFTFTILLFYLALAELLPTRLFAVSIPLVYALLPHYSTDRFWYIAFVANLSVGLYFLSLYSDLRAARAERAQRWGWRIISISGLVCSALAYEAVLPLFFFNPLLVWWRCRRPGATLTARKITLETLVMPMAATILAITVVTVYKTLITRNDPDIFVHQFVIYDRYLLHFAKVVIQATGISYGSYGVLLPVKIWQILQFHLDPVIISVCVSLQLIIFGYLYRLASRPPAYLPAESFYFSLIGVGSLAFISGYAVFLTNSHVAFSTTGVNNRLAIAAAIGVAMIFLGMIGWLSWVLPSALLSRISFCLLVTLLCAGGFLINNSIGAFWVSASRRQQEVITAVRSQFPTLSSDRTLILDGVCPYTGPGIVFEGYWDVSGMFRALYRDPLLKGDTVKRNLVVGDDGLYTAIYTENKFYLYSDRLLLFHIGEKKIYTLTDADAARKYFEEISPNYRNRCPGEEGDGEPIF